MESTSPKAGFSMFLRKQNVNQNNCFVQIGYKTKQNKSDTSKSITQNQTWKKQNL